LAFELGKNLRKFPGIQDHEVAIAMMTIRAFVPVFHFNQVQLKRASVAVSGNAGQGRRSETRPGPFTEARFLPIQAKYEISDC
jgi:hypothetical protein